MEDKPIRMECPSLPNGWQREIVMRKSGLSAGRSDVYYYSPDGKKIRSKPQLEKHLGDMDLGNFDFRNGTFCRRSKRKQGDKDQSYGRDLNGAIIPSPVRQSTKSFSKQPVTYYPSAAAVPRSKKRKQDTANVKTDKEKPKQLFWLKRLEGTFAVNVGNDHVIKDFHLPDHLKVVGPGITQKNLIHSLVTNLHHNASVKGQDRSLIALEKHPEVWLNAEQPLCTPFSITEAEIKKQEEKVATLRRQLSEALAEYDHLRRDSPFK